MSVNNNRVKTYATGGNVETAFVLDTPVDSFSPFVDGVCTYAVVANTGEWQVAHGEVRGTILERGTCEENYLGTADQIDFSGLVIQVAQVLSAEDMNNITTTLDELVAGEGNVYTNEEIKELYENNTNTNAFTDEYMNRVDSSEDDATADQEAYEVPFTPTSANSGTDVQTAISNVETLIDDHIYDASTITYDSTLDTVTLETQLDAALLDHAQGIESNVPSGNGLTSGGKLTAVYGSTSFSIVGGTGLITDVYADVADTKLTEVTWNDQDNVPITPEIGSLTFSSLSVFLDFSQGGTTVIKLTGLIPDQAYRDYIYIGTVSVAQGVVATVLSAPAVAKQTANDLQDLMKTNVYIEGGLVIAVEGSLSVWQKGGSLFYPGVNWYDSNRKNPNILEFIDTSSDNTPFPRNAVTFSTIDRFGNLIDDNTETLVPTNYDNNGVITALAPGQATVHSLYCLGFETNKRFFVLLHGQIVYNSTSLALNGFLSESIIKPNEINNLIHIATIGVAGGATSFASSKDGWIISGASNSLTSFPEDSGDHNNLLGRSDVNQHPVEAIGNGETTGQLTYQLKERTQYWGPWVTGPVYPYNAMVTLGDYLSICTAPDGSIENPAPVVSGDIGLILDNVTELVTFNPVPPPVFSSETLGIADDLVETGMLFHTEEDIFLYQILIKVPANDKETEHKVILRYNPNSATPTVKEYFPTIDAVDTWIVVEESAIIFPKNTEVEIVIETTKGNGAAGYYEDVGYMTGTNYGTNSTGLKRLNGVSQGDMTENCYAVDLLVQNYTMSDEWDILASSSDGASSGSSGGGGAAVWGSITGTISGQADLITELDLKVDDTQVLTDVPSNALFTDTVYTHPTSDGNLHCPVMGTANAGKVLTAGSAIGDLFWGEGAIKPVTDNAPPGTPSEGQEWLDTSSGISYTWYAAGTGQWIKGA